MWVKLTPIELAKARRRRKRKRIINSVFITIFFFLMMVFLEGEFGMMLTDNFFVPRNEIYERIPNSFAFSITVGLLFYFASKEKPSFVCIKCGAAKVTDTSSKCECGGDFENIEEMKKHE